MPAGSTGGHCRVPGPAQYLVSGDDRPVGREQAEALVDRLWLERVAESAGWEGVTDPERLTAAFAGLERAGIVAREHFTCCRTCGTAEIGAEEGADEARGFVYFHRQCTETAADGDPQAAILVTGLNWRRRLVG
ncbi:hypothetical protein GCM10017562_22600 [Streptomyces roseofulvus]